MSVLPSIFISHGAPDLSLNPSPARDFLSQLGQQFQKPKAILVISAHWNSDHPMVSAATHPETIHDFGGFPSALYRLQYPAPGSPQFAYRIHTLLQAANFASEIVTDRGLDHGAWSPLMLSYPDADIPTLQLSIQPRQDAAYHLRLGQALEVLREEVLILASGAVTHNLMEVRRDDFEAPPPYWVSEFTDWLTTKVIAGDIAALVNYRQLAPYAKRNHPTSEHLLPLFVAMGAGGENPQAVQLHSSYTYGVLSMAAFSFVAIACEQKISSQ
jgi:4,5-DOPA dioxygenase extradiol